MKKNLALIATVAVLSTAGVQRANADFFGDIGKAFETVGTVLLGPAKPLLDQVHGAVKHGIDAVKKGVATLTGHAKAAGQQFLDGFVKKVSSTVRTLGKKGAAFGKGLMANIHKSVRAALAHAQKLGRDAITRASRGTIKTLGGLTSHMKGYFDRAFNRARDFAKGTARHVVGTFRGMVSRAKPSLDKILIGLNKNAQAVLIKVTPKKTILVSPPKKAIQPVKRMLQPIK